MPTPLRIAVIGAGAFGRNHLRVLHDLQTQAAPHPNQPPSTNLAATPTAELSSRPEAAGRSGETPVSAPASAGQSPPAFTLQLAAVVDANPITRAEATARYNIPAFATVADLLAANLGLHAATVAVPTVAHAEIATQLLEAGLDVLIEKPLTATLAEADALLALAAARGRILAAGHLERFNPAVTAALPRLTRPMFFEAHRLSVFTPRSLDVDVVLDLMIHDLDIVLTMANSPVTEVRAVGLAVLSPRTDIANVRLEFRSGAVANLTASRVSTEQVRKLRLFQPAQYLSLDYARQELLTINVNPQFAPPTQSLSPRPEAAPTPSLSPRPETAPTPSLSSRPEAAGRSGETPVFAPAPSPSLFPQPHAAPTQPLSSRPEAPPTPSLSSRPETAPTQSLSSRPEAAGRSGETPVFAPAPSGAQAHPSAGLSFEKLDPPRAEPLRLELEDFLHAVGTRTPPRVTAAAARTALALALDINAAIARHAQRAGLGTL